MRRKEEYLFNWLDQWMEVYKKRKIQVSTYQGYVCAIAIITKWFEDRPLRKIVEIDLQGMFNDLADWGYSKSQLHTIKSVLIQSLNRAVSNMKMQMNPAENLFIPKNAGEKRVDALTLDEQQRVIEACKHDMHGEKFMFLLNTGLRRTEFCNLKWEDYNSAEGTLFIRKSKTEAGVRVIPISKICMCIIETQPKLNEYIFNSSIKKPITPCSLKKTYLRLRKTAEVPTLTNHVCRHTYATRLMESGVSPKAISALLGHTSVVFTQNRYVTAQLDYLRCEIQKSVPLIYSRPIQFQH